ncbi:MAG: hypothetical protein ACYC0X_07200 [Pirellulaceae bacterium]
MAAHTDRLELGADVRALLARLRRRIRIYVWVEGLSLALLWLGATFWMGLAIDYLPVLLGASEMPRPARLILLVGIAAILAYVIYRWVFRRAFARLPDQSMAVLLERRFNRFHDGLVTAVEMAERPERARDFNPEMLQRTNLQARAQALGIDVGDVFRLTPLVTKILLALAVIVPVGVLYAINASAVEIWAQRLYLLRDRSWPRNTEIHVPGIQFQRISTTEDLPVLTELVPFDENREIKVAKGSSVVLSVLANATKSIPEYCTIYYQSEENDSGDVNMQKSGRIRESYQAFTYDGKPFRGILSSISFDVRGADHRVRDYRLTVVPSPSIVETKLDCTFPSYMVNEQLSLWLPRTLDLASGTQLPNGTRITLRSRANKDLKKVEIRDVESETTTVYEVAKLGTDPRQIEYAIERLNGNLTLELTLYDTDGVISDPPVRLFIGGIDDQPPAVAATLRGIGTSVTPDVILPARGSITDDYDVAKSWFDVTINDGEPRQFPFEVADTGQLDAALDFRALRADDEGFEIKPKDKLAVTLMAADRCDLSDAPNVGSGDRYQLDVVSPDELLASLERRELGLRRRLEQIIDEIGEMRDSVSRVKRAPADARATAPEDNRETESVAPAEDSAEGAANQTAEEREHSLRSLRTQRSVVQCQKSAQEILGVAASFDDIREELINNRVDSEDRKVRLSEQIAAPLRRIGETLFPELQQQLKDLEQKLNDAIASDQAVDAAVQQADDILLELDKVLQKMLELETFNELMNIVRSLIEDQEALIDKTKKARSSEALELLQ